MKTAWIISGLFLLVGCSNPLPNPINISKSLTNIFSDLEQTGAVSASTVDAWTIDENAKFEHEVRKAQCVSDMADPMVAVIPREVIMGVRRAFQAGAMVQAAGVTMPIGTVGFGGQMNTSSTQTVSVPITFTFVSNIPNVPRPRIEDEHLRRLQRERMVALHLHVSRLIATYNPKLCKTPTLMTNRLRIIQQ